MFANLADNCVLRNLIDLRAQQTPNKTFIVFPAHSEWTYAELRQKVTRTAKGLQDLGVHQGDAVLAWLPNGPAAVEILFAINYLGAIAIPVALGLKGAALAHVIADSGARLMVADSRLCAKLDGLALAQVKTLVAIGDKPEASLSIDVMTEDALFAASGEPAPPEQPIAPWDTQCVLYTSGTTGPAKGVLSSYLNRHAHGIAVPQITGEDRRLVHSPMSHAGGFGSVFGMLIVGGSVILNEAFKTDTFWETVNQYSASVTSLLGAMLPFLMSRPPSPNDQRHGLKLVLIAPADSSANAFSERFGVPVYGVYSMTELSIPLICGPVIDRGGLCGFPRPGVEVQIVDAHDFPVPKGQSGELLVRSDVPWTISHGYLGNAEATAKAWRNGWFHTGDIFRQDPDGSYIYMDRIKDAVRRRGENISSFEVENEILGFPGVKEVAVIGVPSAQSEEEVLAAISPRDGVTLAPAALITYLADRMAHYMVPRYIRIMDELPHTPTQKVLKQDLRDQGVTPDTWDREQHGIKLRREVLK